MAKDNEIRIPIKVDGKEILLTKKEADKLAKSLDKTGTSAHSADRRLKGAAQASSNTTKNFSKMAQGITGGLVPAYATLAANVFAISAAFRFLQDAANYRILIEGQKEYATVTGESLKLLTSRLQEATGQQLAFAEAAQSVAIARAAGITTDQISRLGVLAKNASIALGRDLTDSLNRLIRGATKAEPELLDELGIILRLETASRKYALEIGKTAQTLNIFEKSQAVVNEILAQGEEKFGEFSTELNAFSKLAKSFDDLINRLKISLTGLAEFMAKALTKNTTALAGSFALLGSGILKAITPQIPRIDVEGAAQTASQDVKRFYTGSRLGKFQQGVFGTQDIKALEKAFDAKTSTVLNFENMTRREAERTLNILKARNYQLQGDNAKTYKKMYFDFKANLALMKAEHGKFMGYIKFAGRGLTKIISFAGYAGLLVSMVGVLGQLFDKFRDPEMKEFEEAAIAAGRALKEQNTELGRLNNTLKDTSTLLARVAQISKFFGNFSFAGAAAGFGDIALDRITRTEKINPRERGGPTRTVDLGGRLSGAQKDILTNTIESLRLQQSRLDSTSQEYIKITERVKLYRKALAESNQEGGISRTTFNQVKDSLEKLGEKGTEASERLGKFSSVTRILNNSVTEIETNLAKLRAPQTGLSVITKELYNFGDAIQSIGEELENTPFLDLQKKYEKFFDEASITAMKQYLGEDVFNAIMIAAGGDQATAYQNLGAAIIAESERLHKFEMRMITEKTVLQTNYKTALLGMPKILADQMAKQQKVNELESDIAIQKQYMLELTKKGSKATDAEIATQDTKIKLMEAELNLAKRISNEMTAAQDTLVNTFATSMQSAISGLIQGTMTLKDAFKSMAQAVLQQLAQILAQMMAMRLMGAMFPGFGAFMGAPMGRQGGIMKSPGYRSFSEGGISDGPTSGYPAMLHGTEAVVPLPNGRSIPVEMQGNSGGTNNVVINVDANGGTSSTMDGERGKALGMAIQVAVMETIQREKRPGGVLSRN